MDRWVRALGLDGWWTFTHEFTTEAIGDDEGSTQADTQADWRLREAAMTWYLERTITLSDAQLDNLVVHEMTHCLLAPIAPKEKGESDLLEYVTESVAKAILLVSA